MSWEEELDDIQEKEKKGEKDKNKIVFDFDDECNEIKVTKKVQQETLKPKEKEVDYEALYQQRKQKDIEEEKKIEESIKYIQDPVLRLKKKLELMQLKQAEKFLGVGEEKPSTNTDNQEFNLDFPLKVEKDYIALATKTAALINSLGKENKYNMEFLKASFEELLSQLGEEDIGELIKSIKIISTKKYKDKAAKKKKEKMEPKKETPPPKSDKFEERKKLYKQYGDGDIEGERDPNDYNDDGDFM